VVAHPSCSLPGGTNENFYYLQEIMCSILDIAGVEVPDQLDGQSFLPAMLGNQEPNGREEVYCVFDRHFTVANQRMVRTRSHQFTFNSSDTAELYDLIEDPYQLNNLIRDPAYQAVKKDLKQRMSRYMNDLNDPVKGWFNRISGAL